MLCSVIMLKFGSNKIFQFFPTSTDSFFFFIISRLKSQFVSVIPLQSSLSHICGHFHYARNILYCFYCSSVFILKTKNAKQVSPAATVYFLSFSHVS